MRIAVNGTQINYDVSGPPGGPAIVMGHSLASSRVMWDPQLSALSGKYRVMRFDTRGHGLSAVPSGAYTVDQLADDALALMDALGIAKAHWIGLSMGGVLGQNIALRRPERLLSLALCNTLARVAPEARAVWTGRIATAEAEGVGPMADTTMQRWFTQPYLQKNPPELQTIRAEYLNTPRGGYVGCCHALSTLDYLDRLTAVKAPTLVIVGRQDMGTPVAMSEAIAGKIPGAKLVVVENAAHLGNIEQPEIYTRELLALIQRAGG
ncbi:MAG: 3-oxoadipate enol-lactonase [Alphaproteobacteria bacterium]|nr:3-oxoadipate enol-lactonase [Alphaproteobacteria bacterium]